MVKLARELSASLTTFSELELDKVDMNAQLHSVHSLIQSINMRMPKDLVTSELKKELDRNERLLTQLLNVNSQKHQNRG